MKTKKKIPKFKHEKDERVFWETHDSTEYVDWSTAKSVIFPDLKPTTKAISLRLPEGLLLNIKMLANKQDIPYQSLIKMILAEHTQRKILKK